MRLRSVSMHCYLLPFLLSRSPSLHPSLSLSPSFSLSVSMWKDAGLHRVSPAAQCDSAEIEMGLLGGFWWLQTTPPHTHPHILPHTHTHSDTWVARWGARMPVKSACYLHIITLCGRIRVCLITWLPFSVCVCVCEAVWLRINFCLYLNECVCVCVWESASVDRHFQAIKPKHSINQFDKYTNRSSSAANNDRASASGEGRWTGMKLGHNWNETGTGTNYICWDNWFLDESNWKT